MHNKVYHHISISAQHHFKPPSHSSCSPAPQTELPSSFTDRIHAQISVVNMCDVCVSHHGIILQFVHEVSSLGSLVVVEPHAALELVPGVQQQHVALGGADLLDHRGSAGHSGETPAAPRAAAAFPGVLAGLLHPGVHVVGVEEDQVPGRRGGHGEAQQEDEEAEAEPRQSAHLRAQRSHLSAARKHHWRRKPGCFLT